MLEISKSEIRKMINENLDKILKEDMSGFNGKKHINPEEYYDELGMFVAPGHDPLEEINNNIFNGLLDYTNPFFNTPMHQFKVVRGYLDYEQRRGSKPTFDGFLSHIGHSRRELNQYDTGYRSNKNESIIKMASTITENILNSGVKELNKTALRKMINEALNQNRLNENLEDTAADCVSYIKKVLNPGNMTDESLQYFFERFFGGLYDDKSRMGKIARDYN